MKTEIPVHEALAIVRQHAKPLAEKEQVPLARALGRVLAEDLPARCDHPDVANTAVDGYAVRAADTEGASPAHPVALRLVGESPAGRPFSGALGPGEAVAIFTGSPLPEGADAVVAVEHTRREGERVLIFKPGSAKDIRPKGDDFQKGEVLLQKGDLLTPGRIGLAAAMGHAEVPVVRKPRVGILSTGDEVVPPGEPLPPGGVYDSNSYAVAALVAGAGGEPVILGRAKDDRSELKAQLAAAGELDLLLTSGGVSMGEYDLVRKLLEEEGEIYFWKILQRPGHPPIFGRYRNTLVFGLPGNPVSAMVVFFLYGRPMLFGMLGRNDPPYRRIRVRIEDFFKGAKGKVAFRRAALEYRPDVGFVARSAGNQSSGAIRTMAEGHALVAVPPDRSLNPGDEAWAIPFDPEALGAPGLPEAF